MASRIFDFPTEKLEVYLALRRKVITEFWEQPDVADATLSDLLSNVLIAIDEAFLDEECAGNEG
ncbi:MAG TPA: hypothetical protein VKM72_23645 [Thermoanaerobaculia bacterium]|nr:hypothetical protein [Thermoanaerobaculia bacterium]